MILKNNLPSSAEAAAILAGAERLNPGAWVRHSEYAAQAAKLIAENCIGLNAEKAYILGLLHDIGRRFGATQMRHCLDGYTFMTEYGFDAAAKICLTHSFQTKNIKEAFGIWDCSDSEYDFIVNYLSAAVYDDYDKLIQLCDTLALPSGFVLIEKRMVDVALRHGVLEDILPKWKATFEIKEYFEGLIGRSIYSILPGVVENTFGF
jgi:hypothetical protein